MAIVFQEKRQRYLLFTFLCLLFIILLIIYFGLLRKKEPFFSPIVYKPRLVKINFEILEKLKKSPFPIEEIKPLQDSKGRTNPFLPYP